MFTQSLAPTPIKKRLDADRRFYLIMAVASALLIFAGFSRTYFLKFRFPQSPALSLLVHIHALIFTTWIAYFLLQTYLIAIKRPTLHRSLGLFGAFLGTLVIVMGLTVAVVGMRLHHGTATQDAETIFLVALTDIGSFALFFILGYRKRRNREAHQRLMLLSVIVGLTGAALGRLINIGVPIPALSLINFSFLFAGPIYDFTTRRRVHKVYVYGVLFALATFTPLRFLLGATRWWHHMAHLLSGS